MRCARTLSVPASAQTLVEAAAAAAAARAASGTTAPKPRTVFTDKDVTPATPSARPATATMSTATTAPGSPAGRQTEAYWRARLAPLAAQLRRDVDAAAPVVARLTQLTNRLEPNAISLSVLGPEITRLTGEAQMWSDRMHADRAAIDALEEEGRRAGAFPGWFR